MGSMQCNMELGYQLSTYSGTKVQVDVLKLKLSCDRRPVSVGVELPFGTNNQLFFLSENCTFLYIWHPLWREDMSVISSYNWLWALPEQSLSGLSPAELTTIFYCLIWDSPYLKGQVSEFITPKNRVTQLDTRALSSHFVASYDTQG
jgi:hypothetical protein